MKRRPALQSAESLPIVAEPISRREWLLLAAIVAVGVLLRGWAVSHSAVEHFDEGVYASNLFFGPPDFAYPQRTMYAPPLLPWLIELGMLTGLPPNLAALLPGFLAGCGTIVALWWFGRSWFGPGVGLSAATLCSLSDYHIAYSATALTDVLLGLWIVLAVDAIARSLFRNDFRWAIGGGIYTGLAWWTKYNGWLPLAIEGAALPLLYLLLQPDRQRLLGWLACFAVTAVVAVLAWSPYYLSLAPGEYAAITANHAKAVVGFSGWLNSASQQIFSQQVIEGFLTPLGVGLAAAAAGMLIVRTRLQFGWLIYGHILGSALFAWFVTGFVMTGIAGPVGLATGVAAVWRAPRHDEYWIRRGIGLALVAAWWSGLFVATPSYWPFPRLVLPWLISSWIGTAVSIEVGLASEYGSLVQPKDQSTRPILIGAILVGGLCLLSFLFPRRTPHESSIGVRDSLQQISRQLKAQVGADATKAIYVYGEPALFFQLRAAREELVQPVQSLPEMAATIDGQPIPTYLVAGPHANRDPQFQAAMSAVKDRWDVVRVFPHRPSAIVWLDLYDPRAPLPENAAQLDEVRIYRLKAE